MSLGMVLFGMPFFLAGGWLVLAGAGVLPIDKRDLTVPPWVLVPVGLAFALPGCAYVSAGLTSMVRGRPECAECPGNWACYRRRAELHGGRFCGDCVRGQSRGFGGA